MGFMKRIPVSGDPQAQVATTIHCVAGLNTATCARKGWFEGCTGVDRLCSRKTNICMLDVYLGTTLSTCKHTTIVFLLAPVVSHRIARCSMQHVLKWKRHNQLQGNCAALQHSHLIDVKQHNLCHGLFVARGEAFQEIRLGTARHLFFRGDGVEQNLLPVANTRV